MNWLKYTIGLPVLIGLTVAMPLFIWFIPLVDLMDMIINGKYENTLSGFTVSGYIKYLWRPIKSVKETSDE